MCTLFSGPLIINTKKNEKFSNIEQKLIDENKVLENKKLIFVSNAIQLDRLKTVKENNLFDNSIILIIASQQTEQTGQKEQNELDKE